MDGFKFKNTHHLGTKRKRESSPHRSSYLEVAAGFGLTGNGKKGDRYVRDLASYTNIARQHDQYLPQKPIPTGPRNHRQLPNRPPQQAIDIDSRKYLHSGGFGPGLSHLETINAQGKSKFILKNGKDAEKLNNSNYSPIRESQKAFTSTRRMEPQDRYMKKSISRSSPYEDSKGIRKDVLAEISQREFARKERFSPIESASTLDEERAVPRRPRHSVITAKNNYSEAYNQAKMFMDRSSLMNSSGNTGLKTAVGSGITLGTESVAVTVNEFLSYINQASLPPPSLAPTNLQTSMEAAQVLSSHLPPEPFSNASKDNATQQEFLPSGFHYQNTRKSTPMSTSAMSISSGSSPVHSPACNSPNTSLRTFSPTRSSTSSSLRRKGSTCILCKGPAAPPLKALIRCIECKHNYHTHCHTPRIIVTNGKFDVDVKLWVCSRCTKIHNASPKLGSYTAKLAVATTSLNRSSGCAKTPAYKRRRFETEFSPVLNRYEMISHCGDQVASGCPPEKNDINTDPVPQASIGRLADKVSPDGSYETIPSLPSDHNTDTTFGLFNKQLTQKDVDNIDDEDTPMDLDSPPRSPRPCSPRIEQLSSSEARSNIRNEAVAVLQASDTSTQTHRTTEDIAHSETGKSNLADLEGTGRDSNSPPYSPRLDPELSTIPIAKDNIPILPPLDLPMSDALKQDASKQTVSINPTLPLQPITQNSTLLSIPLQLMIPSVPAAVAPVNPLTLLGPTTTFPCANCGKPWAIFLNTARSDGRNYCVHCLYLVNQQESPRVESSYPLAKVTAQEQKSLSPLPKEHRSQPLQAQLKPRFERDSSSSYSPTISRTAAVYKPLSRPHLPEPTHPKALKPPTEKIKTAQQIMEERYQPLPEIFPANSRLPPSRDTAKPSEERPTVTQVKDKCEGKDGPKKKLTVTEYALRQKEKEKKLDKKGHNTSISNSLVQEEEVMCNPETPEIQVTLESSTVKSVTLSSGTGESVTPESCKGKSDTLESSTGKQKPELESSGSVAAAVEAVFQVEQTGSMASGETEALQQMQGKMNEEIERWKKKFEEQRGFVSNYVKHNAKIMGKLNQAEHQKSVLEKKTAALEAENTGHRKKHEQLVGENEQLKQQRLQREEEEFQARLRAELEISEAQAEAMSQISQCNDENNGQKDKQEFLMKNVYKSLTFDIINPLQDIIGLLTNIPDKPTIIPKPRHSVTRKSEVLNFNSTNLCSLHLHREVNRTLTITATRDSDTPVSGDKSRHSTTSGESDGKGITFEEFARIPSNMVPVLKDGVLAFREGQINPRTRRLDRIKSDQCYKVGRDVPGELRN